MTSPMYYAVCNSFFYFNAIEPLLHRPLLACLDMCRCSCVLFVLYTTDIC